MANPNIVSGFDSLANLNLWFKLQSGDSLTLAEVPSLISLRWTYFRDNWNFIVDGLKNKSISFKYPDMLDKQILMLTRLIKIQRNNANINPLSDSDTYVKFYAVWQNIEIASIPITQDEQSFIDNRVNVISRYIRTDFIDIRDNLANARDILSDIVGTSDPLYDSIYNRGSSVALRDVSIKDIGNMQNFQSAIKAVDFILANSEFLTTTTIDPFALARANADNDELDIESGRSGTLVRMFFGDTLEDLAYRHLGSNDRWIEIAIANGLRPPYIDEIGEKISLLTNGSSNQIILSELDINGIANINKLHINQVILIKSDGTTSPEQRTIINIKEVPISGDIILELSGDTDLNKYQIFDNAYIRVFKINTINSNFLVTIPQPEVIEHKNSNNTPFFLESKAEDEKLAGVDLLVDDNFDLSFTAFSDVQLNFGLANAQQAIQMKMLQEQGQNTRHPELGLPAIQGKKSNKFNGAKQSIISSITNMIEEDIRFNRVEQLDVVSTGPSTVTINVKVRMAGSGSLIPLSFTINVG